jgi:hypothetical protein
MNEHPEINKPRPPRPKTKAEREEARERKNLQQKEDKMRRASGLAPIRGP